MSNTGTVVSHNEIVEHTDEEGNVTTTEEPVYTEVVIHEEGEEWGVRPDGIFFAEAAYQRRNWKESKPDFLLLNRSNKQIILPLGWWGRD